MPPATDVADPLREYDFVLIEVIGQSQFFVFLNEVYCLISVINDTSYCLTSWVFRLKAAKILVITIFMDIFE